jgi:hypothetical protein
MLPLPLESSPPKLSKDLSSLSAKETTLLIIDIIEFVCLFGMVVLGLTISVSNFLKSRRAENSNEEKAED